MEDFLIINYPLIIIFFNQYFNLKTIGRKIKTLEFIEIKDLTNTPS